MSLCEGQLRTVWDGATDQRSPSLSPPPPLPHLLPRSLTWPLLITADLGGGATPEHVWNHNPDAQRRLSLSLLTSV